MEGTPFVPSTGRTALLDRPFVAARSSSPAPSVRAGSADTVAISDSARRASLAAAPAAPANVPGIRGSLVERVRAEIAAGSYLNESRLDGALDALLRDLA